MSRNVGIDNAKGEYLYFVDSDDFIEKDTIEYLYNLCENNNVKLSTSMPLMIFDYNYKKRKIKEKVKIINSYEMLKKIVIAKDSTGTTWNKLYKKELFDNIRFENRIINDIVVTYKLAIAAEKIAYSNQQKYYYLKHKNSITVGQNSDYGRMTDYYKASFERYNFIKQAYPNLIENDIGMMRNIIKTYIVKNPNIEKFLEEQDAITFFKELFSFKILFSRIHIKLKIVIFAFRINPRLLKK